MIRIQNSSSPYLVYGFALGVFGFMLFILMRATERLAWAYVAWFESAG